MRSFKQRIYGSDIYNSRSEHRRPEVDVMRTCCQWGDSGGKGKIGEAILTALSLCC